MTTEGFPHHIGADIGSEGDGVKLATATMVWNTCIRIIYTKSKIEISK